MKLKSTTIAILIFVIFFGGIGVSKTIGYWNTKSNRFNKGKSISNDEIDRYEEHEHEDDSHEEENKINGEITFNEAVEMGITHEEIESVLDTKVENYNILIKDYCHKNNIRFSEVKNKLQKILDKKIINNDKNDSKDEIEHEIQKSKYSDGVYKGIAEGYKSNITVEVTIKDNEINDVQIVSHNESHGYYEEPIDIIPKQIIKTQSTGVDTISGATWTSRGILNAVNDALSKARNNQ